MQVSLVPMLVNPITQIVNWLEHLMQTIGAPGAALAVLLENVFPPIPSELILPLAGFAAAQGHFTVWSAIAWTTAGSVAGAWILYWAGRAMGVDRLRTLADRMPLARSSDIDRATGWFEKYGAISVLVGRMVPGVRSLISVPAGVARMSPVSFTLWTALGSAGWNALLIFAGHQLGSHWTRVEGWVASAQNVVVAVVVALVTWFVIHRLRHRERDASR